MRFMSGIRVSVQILVRSCFEGFLGPSLFIQCSTKDFWADSFVWRVAEQSNTSARSLLAPSAYFPDPPRDRIVMESRQRQFILHGCYKSTQNRERD